MYEKHFRLEKRPFSIAPDPHFLFMSARHREALAHLLYGIGEGGGFVQLTGEVGTGKTTLCRALLEQLPGDVNVAVILNPKVTALELIATLCDELHVPYPKGTSSIKTVTDALNRHLLQAHSEGKRTVMVIDEGQNLQPEVLEQVRLLTNLETAREKLLQIILIGQPELRELLSREDLRQLAQRVTARYHLDPMNRPETEAYIRHRLQVCGVSSSLFTKGALDNIHRITGGVPRLINVLCDRSLLGGYVEGKNRVNTRIVRRAAGEVMPASSFSTGNKQQRNNWFLAASLVLVAFTLAVIQWWPEREVARDSHAAQSVPSAPALGEINRKGEMAVVRSTSLPGHEDAAIEAVPAASVSTIESELNAEAAEEQKAQDSVDRLFTLAAEASEEDAWRVLLARWGVASQGASGEQVCRQLPTYGMHCMRDSGSWKMLRSFDHPAILYLMGPDAERVAVVLQGIRAGAAELVIGDNQLSLPIGELQQYWYGDYALVWKAPPGNHTVLRLGDRNPTVAWVREQLQAPVASTPGYFDSGLRDAVMRFQREQILEPDGVVGALTLIHLNRLAAQSGRPRLLTEAG